LTLTGAEILALKQAGKTWNQIADESGEPYNAIRNRCRRYMKRNGAAQTTAPPQPQKLDDGERVTDEITGNTREVISQSTRISNIDQLIEHCKIDLEKWVIERYRVGKHDVGRKHTIKEMTWDEGKMTGSLSDSGELKIEPMWIIHASMVKRHPEAIHPVISPVNITTTYTRRSTAPTRQLKRALIIPDTQFGFSRDVYRGKLTPFHDRRALDVVLQIARVIMPDRAVVLGDINDFSGWSDKFIVMPEFYFTTQPALIESAWYLRQVRDVTCGEMDLIDGNHDNRLEKQTIIHMVHAYQLKSADNLDAAPVLSIDNLLGLSRMGITYHGPYPSAEVWLNNTTRCIHGDKVRAQPGQTASAVVRDANENTIYGHCHRREMAVKTVPYRGGYRTVTAYSPGCLCHVDGRVPGSKRGDQWQQGAAVVYYDEETASICPIDIFDGKAVFDGKVYEGRDYVDDLRRDTGWEQF
jgi:hypothetical protein